MDLLTGLEADAEDLADESEPVANLRLRWHCRACPKPTALRFHWQTFAGGKRHVRMECAGCGRFLRYAPKTAFVLAMAERSSSPGQTTEATSRA
jgi:hypothetical protein